MAYMSTNICPGGPYPNKAGEYCGNHHNGSPPLYIFTSSRETPEQAKKHQEEYLATMRFGRPRPCETGTTEEMEAQGYVGLYLKKTRQLMYYEVECPTPDWLLEPSATVASKEKVQPSNTDVEQKVRNARDDLLKGWFT